MRTRPASDTSTSASKAPASAPKAPASASEAPASEAPASEAPVPVPVPDPPDAAWAQAVASCRGIVDAEVRPLRDRYRRRASRHQLFYRLSGLATLLLAVSLPLLAGLRFDHRDVALSVVGVCVAVLTGLREFYRWDEVGSRLRRTENALSDALLRWELAVSDGVPAADPEQGPRACYTATEELLTTVRAIRDAQAAA
ncbi:Protein of unknown function (DUF4231) [Parafrankia irregularis]|uniref:SMODS and SLOG-associating 2TM effector domain-containing protein n=1 Tax=Parafrankia irregularis TaxID=795642 RepID=A0A0S4QI50_9ACTN|nr:MULTISPECIES: DUF4231 domain-containing protein [Parafrankia]MBE3203946.1 DUF4231 domain-containing protein [Parafrankia sp. CH37]CUU55181.1 Protein of unknown function (DUF4231) [Parafrankia irregularis]